VSDAAQFSAEDRRYMRAAMREADRARGHTRPNPAVGALLVRGGKVLARGRTQAAGGRHAEIDALARARDARGATLYTTLEPCCHTGRTGPCTAAIRQAGVARVVVGCRDLNPQVSGKGIARLRRIGIRVDVGCLEAECFAQNRAFFRWIREGRPWVTLKVAATLDGFIAPRPPRPRGIHWITGPAARSAAHELRAAHDAVLVGAGTVLADDPRLTVRNGSAGPQPLRVVLDGQLRTPVSAKLLKQEGPRPLLVGSARPRDGGQARRHKALLRAGADVLLLPSGRDGAVAVPALLAALAEREVQSLLVEGGSRVLGAFIAARAADAVAWFLAPRLAGAGVPVVEGPGLDWGAPLALAPPTVKAVGHDLLVTADVIPDSRRPRG
jgi:diaminohydroxyphosphoribosylaminopyrimidine deaminase/5-amino-6-(5-phosphoribosylamino)uracil reductase